jgi:hypothetical protein
VRSQFTETTLHYRKEAFQNFHLVPGGPSLYQLVRSKAVDLKRLIDLGGPDASYYLGQSPKDLGFNSDPKLWSPTDYTKFLGALFGSTPSTLAGFSDFLTGTIVIAPGGGSWGDPNALLLHELLHFTVQGPNDPHQTWDEFLNAFATNPNNSGDSNATFTDWLVHGCPKKK